MLNHLRLAIDEIDEKLIILLAKRMEVSQAIGDYKKANNLAPLDEKRWQKVLTSRIKLGKAHGLSREAVTQVWEIIHQLSLQAQR